jgi:endonuclease G
VIIKAELIQDSKSRLTFNPKQLSEQLGEDNRHRWLTTEQKENRMRQLISQTGSPERARTAFERIINGNDLVSINYLAKGLLAGRAVGRIQLRVSSGDVVGYGTGFLIGPGVLMTNQHVFESAADAQHSMVDFDYELGVDGRERVAYHFALDPQRHFYSNHDLDFATVAVVPQSLEGGRDLASYGWLKLSGEPGKSDPGEYLTIIQHPGGEMKQVCVRENKLLKYLDQTLWYLTDTVAGSSGSPVFNRFWQVAALHHSGVPRTDSKGNWLTKDGKIWDGSTDESLVDWIANEGIRISSIVDHLRQKLSNDPLIKGVLEAPDSSPQDEKAASNGHGTRFMSAPSRAGADLWAEGDGDSVSLVVPLRIPIDFIRKGAVEPRPAANPAPALTAARTNGNAAASLIEKVEIDQTTLGTRPGYKPSFLGVGNLSVPLPKIPASMKSKVATLLKQPSESELKYFNYSVVMNKQRKLAFFSAVNIDGKLRRDIGKREGDRWYTDPRIDKDIQLGDDFYKRQALDEARENNPFDRGHLVRRLDATWGDSEAEAKEHGDDSFHFTNCSPQFFAFNQGKKLWLGLEEFVLDQLEADKRKACVINGPVFDGPLAEEGGLPDADGDAKADPTFKKVSIPKFFWKLMVIEDSGKLAAAAFLLSQQDQLLAIDRIEEKLTPAEAKLFQISVSDLAKFTKLDFGALAQSDTKEVARRAAPRRVESLADIHFFPTRLEVLARPGRHRLTKLKPGRVA